MQEWLNTFDVGGKIKGKVAREEFINYYTNVGAIIENEDYFELMLIHAWKPQGIPQGRGRGLVPFLWRDLGSSNP